MKMGGPQMPHAILEVRDLSIGFGPNAALSVVESVNFDLMAGGAK